jgi:hypothetical protein
LRGKVAEVEVYSAAGVLNIPNVKRWDSGPFIDRDPKQVQGSGVTADLLNPTH